MTTRRQRVMATIVYGNEYMGLYADGSIDHPSLGMPPSGEWKIIDAVTLNNLGGVVRRYSLEAIIANPSAIPWQHRNGKQKTFVRDVDHGTKRQWNSPTYYIY